MLNYLFSAQSIGPLILNLNSITNKFYLFGTKSSAGRWGDFPNGMSSARGVFIGFSTDLLNIPLNPPLFAVGIPTRERGTFDADIQESKLGFNIKPKDSL